MKTKTRIKVKKQWFTWHLFPQPKDVPIQSVYEIVFFGLIFCICVYIYFECNEIPYCQETIHIECLDNKNPGDKYENNYLYPKASIYLRMPCTSVSELKTNKEVSLAGKKRQDNFLSVQFSDYLISGGENYIETNEVQNAVDKKKKIEEHYKKRKQFIEGYNRMNRLADSLLSNHEWANTQEFRKLKDSLYSDFSILSNRKYRETNTFSFNKSNEKYDLFKSLHSSFGLPEEATTPLYYYRFDQTVRKKYLNIFARLLNHFDNSDPWKYENGKDTIEGFVGDNNSLQRTEYRKKEICQDGFSFATTVPRITTIDPYEVAIGDPGWLSFEDISQAYYHINIISETIDTIQLRINFVGSTEFSKVIPEPDEMTMSTLVYTDGKKISKIKKDGLLFHAKFTELENRQTIRMFFLTAVMSALFTIFIVFTVLALYKIATRKSIEKDSHPTLNFQNEKGTPQISENGCVDIE